MAELGVEAGEGLVELDVAGGDAGADEQPVAHADEEPGVEVAQGVCDLGLQRRGLFIEGVDEDIEEGVARDGVKDLTGPTDGRAALLEGQRRVLDDLEIGGRGHGACYRRNVHVWGECMPDEPETIGGFSRIEYLAVFNAIIFGFVVTEFLKGWGTLLRLRHTIVIDRVHIAWSVLTFLLAILTWWGSWTNHDFIGRHIGYFYYSLIVPVLLFVITTLLFPRIDAPERFDARAFFASNVPTLHVTYATFFVVLVVNSQVFDEYAVFHPKTAFKLGAAILMLSGLVWRSRRFQIGLTVAMAALLVLFIIGM